MIKRAVFREYIDGPGMSFNDVVLKDCAHEYTASVTVDELHERDYGVIVVRGDVAFTVPWPSVKFTMGPVESFFDVPRNAEDSRLAGLYRNPALDDEACEAQRTNEMTAAPREPLAPKTNARPCPVCVGVEEQKAIDRRLTVPIAPNHRSRVSFLCEEHATPENVKLFRKEKP